MSDQNLPPDPPEGTGTNDPELAPEARSTDRRQSAGVPPGGFERRQWGDRRRRNNEGRERYLDMVQRERTVLLEQGVSRSTEQLLDMAGVGGASEMEEEGIRDRATGDMLRSLLPVQSWLPLSIHLIGLKDGVMKIAPLHEVNDRQIKTLLSTANRCGLAVQRIDIEMWDRAELIQTLRRVHDLSADRSEKTLAQWMADIDNGLLLNQFQRDMMAEALQMRASDIHLLQDGNPDTPNWIKYRIDGDLVPMHLLTP
jgi:general secretion pathway protein E